MLAATRRLFGAIETFKGEARGMADMLLGELRIGLSESLDDAVMQRLADAIRRFRSRRQAVRIELLSAMPAELERRLLQDQLHLAIGYFSGNQQALAHRPLFVEEQLLFCGAGHPLFDRTRVTESDLRQCDRVLHPYRFIGEAEPFQSAASSAVTEQVEGTLALILSGAHIGYLPATSPRPGRHAGNSAPCCRNDWASTSNSASPTTAAGSPAKRSRRSSKIWWPPSAPCRGEFIRQAVRSAARLGAPGTPLVDGKAPSTLRPGQLPGLDATDLPLEACCLPLRPRRYMYHRYSRALTSLMKSRYSCRLFSQ